MPTRLRNKRGDWVIANQILLDFEEGFQQLLLTYTPRLSEVAFGVLRHQQSAEDAVQLAWIKAYQALRRSPSHRLRSMNFQGWLVVITRNIACDLFHQEHKLTFRSDEDLLEQEGHRFDRPDLAFIHQESMAELQMLIEALPPIMRRSYACATLTMLSIQKSPANSAILLARSNATSTADYTSSGKPCWQKTCSCWNGSRENTKLLSALALSSTEHHVSPS